MELVEEGITWQDRFQEGLRNAPWWLVSAVFHALLMVVLINTDFMSMPAAEEELIIQTEIEDEDEEEPVKPEEIKRDIFPEELVEPVFTETKVQDTPVTQDTVDPTEEIVEDVDFEELVDPMQLNSIDEEVTAVPIGDNVKLTVIGTGDLGKGGYYVGRVRGRSPKRLKRVGGSPASESAVEAGLRWLARNQEEKGNWDAVKHGAKGPYDVGVSGLALLSFLGAGHTETDGKHRSHVKRALHWLGSVQQQNGRFGCPRFYGEGICAMAVSEAYGMSRNPTTGRMAQRAIDFIVEKQPADGGYGYGGPGNDTSVTGWQIMAMKSGKVARLHVPEQAIERAKIYLRDSIDEKTGMTGYRKKTGPRPSMTAVGILCRQFLGWKRNTWDLQKGADVLKKSGPNMRDYYYLYYGTLSMFQMGGSYWEFWNEAFRDKLIAAQVNNAKDPNNGSWPPTTHFGGHAGRVFTTAMAVLSLEVYYRYLPVYK